MSLRILHWAAVCPACIQSFLIDNDKPYDTQREMIARSQAEGLCGSKDAPTDYVLDHNVDKFCALHGIECRKLEDRKSHRKYRREKAYCSGAGIVAMPLNRTV